MKHICPFLSILLFLSACSTIHVPSMQNAALLREKNDVEITANNNNIQLAWAPVSRVGIFASGHHRSKQYETEMSHFRDYFRDHTYFEVGPGFNIPMKNNFSASIFAGAGKGVSDIGYWDRFYNSIERYTYKNTRYVIQPNFGYSDKFTDIIFSGRIAMMRYSNLKVTENYSQLPILVGYISPQHEPPFYFNDKPYLFFEPALTFRIGYKFLKFHTQFVYSASVLDKQHIAQQPYNLNAGITLQLHPDLFKKKDP